MATSGSYDWTSTRNEIIRDAIEDVGGVGLGEALTNDALNQAAYVLNRMMKAWQTKGIRLWTQEWTRKTLSASSEVTGTDGNYYRCILSHTSATATNKPITGTEWSTFWYQDGTTGGVWADATAYSSIGDFTPEADTLDITQAFIRKTDGSDDHQIELISIEDYLAIPHKFNTGTPNKMAFHKVATAPKCYLYHHPDDTTYVLHYLKVRKLEDFDAAANNQDAWETWIEAIVKGLSYRLAPKYSLPEATIARMKIEADEAFKYAHRSDKDAVDEDFVKGAY